MKPQQVTMYRTSDNQTFNSESQAEQHEYDIQNDKIDTAHDYVLSMIEQHNPSRGNDTTRAVNETLAWRILYSRKLSTMLFVLDRHYIEIDIAANKQYFDELEQELKQE